MGTVAEKEKEARISVCMGNRCIYVAFKTLSPNRTNVNLEFINNKIEHVVTMLSCFLQSINKVLYS